MISASIHHICIQTSDYEASKAFYCDMLGFEVEQESAGFHGRAFNSWLKLGDFRIELQTGREGEPLSAYDVESEGIVHFCLLVDSVEEAYKTLTAKGFNHYKLKNGEPLYRVCNSLLLKLVAPEGTIIELRDQAAL